MSIKGNGANGSIAISHGEEQYLESGDAIEIWFRTAAIGIDQILAMKIITGVDEIGWDFRIRSGSNKVRYIAWNNEEILGNFNTINVVTDGLWHWLMCRIEGKTMYGYLDGIYQGWNNNPDWDDCENNGSLQIGSGIEGEIGGLAISDTKDLNYINSRAVKGKKIYIPDETTRVFIPMRENSGSNINDIRTGKTGSLGAGWSWGSDPGYFKQ